MALAAEMVVGGGFSHEVRPQGEYDDETSSARRLFGRVYGNERHLHRIRPWTDLDMVRELEKRHEIVLMRQWEYITPLVRINDKIQSYVGEYSKRYATVPCLVERDRNIA